MIQLYNKGQTDFSKKGITLNAQTAAVTFQDNGRFDLDLTMAMPENITLDYGMIIRCSVPEQHVPEITLGTVSYYEVSNAEGSTLWSVVPTLKRVYYKQWIGYSQTEGVHEYSVGDKVTYLNNNYRCTYFDSESQVATVPPNNSSWWERISNTTGQAGKAAAEVDYGDVIMKTGDFNDEYMEAATTSGKTGYILIADVTATGDTETRTIPAQTITAQNFTITEIEKTSDGKQVTIHAEHVSYGLGRTMLGDCNLVGVNPATAVLFIQGAMKEDYDGEIYTNLSDDLSITANWSWKNAQNAILDPKAGLLQYTAGQMIRNDLDVFLIEKAEAVPKYEVKYGTNLTAVKYDGSVTDTVTRIYPTAQAEDGSTLLLPEEHIDTVRVVPFIHPEVLDTGLKVGTTETQSDGTEVELTEDVVFTRMREAAQNRFTIDECDKIDITLEVDWVHLPDTEEYKAYADLRNAAPGEWVQVTDGPLGIYETIQLTGYTFDPILEKYTKATFGKNKVSPGVASYDIQTGAIGSRALGAGAVGSQNIQANSITAREIEAGSITAEKIASRSITAETIAANAITADAINAGAVTAAKIAAQAITAEKIAANAITAGAIAAEAVQANNIAANAVTATKIAAGAVEASKIAALAITTEKLAAGAVTAEKIGAGSITAAKIDTTDLEALQATLQIASIANAQINSADINYAHVKDLVAGTAIFDTSITEQGIADRLYINRLLITYGQMVEATIGDLVIGASDGYYYHVDVEWDEYGEPSLVPTRVATPSAAEIAAGHTTGGQTIIGNVGTFAELSSENFYAINSIIDRITAKRIDVDSLWARQAFIDKLMVQDISSNTYIQSTIGNWTSQSTITQTIAGLDSRISSLGYGTVYMQPEEPSHSELVAGDIWIQTMSDGSWEEIYENYDSWEQIYNEVSSWQVLGSVPKMWVWDGNKFQLMYDALLPTTMETEIQQLASAITLKATKEEVDLLSNEVTEFAATLTIQADEIEAAVSAVNAKAASYVMWIDPTTIYSVSLGDMWIKRDAEGFCDQTTWEDLYDNFDSWEAFYEYHDAWCDMLGDRTFVWNGTEWLETSDRAAEIYQKTLIDQTTTSVTILAESTATLEGNMITVQAALTVANDRITQEVSRATTAEAGKIEKTSQIQTVSEIISEAVRQSNTAGEGLFIQQTSVYQTPEQIVTQAVSQAVSGASGLYVTKTTNLQTADSIVNEAVRQSGVNAANGYIAKSGIYQTPESIVSAVEQWTNGVLGSYSTTEQTSTMIRTAVETYVDGQLASYSTTQQTSTMISQYVTNNAYGLVSGITITSSGVDISGSQYVNIASGGWFKVTTGNFGIDTNVAAAGYVMWSGSSNASEAGFRLKKNGELTITKLMALNKNGTEEEVNLRATGLWKLAYKTVDAVTTSGGYCTAMSFSDGSSVNFNSAASVTLTGGWGGNTYTVTASNGETESTTLHHSISIPDYGYTINTFDATTHQTGVMILDENSEKVGNLGFKIDATSVFEAGYDDCFDAVEADKTDEEIKTALEESETHSTTLTISADEEDIITRDIDASGVYSNGYQTASGKVSNTANTDYVVVPSGSSGTSNIYISYSLGDLDKTAGSRSISVTANTIAKKTFNLTDYKVGWNECRDACVLQERYLRYAGTYGGSGNTHYIKSGNNYISVGADWYTTVRSDAYSRPAAK